MLCTYAPSIDDCFSSKTFLLCNTTYLLHISLTKRSTMTSDDFTAFDKAFVIIPKISGCLSMMGSGWIMFHVLRSQTKSKLVYHRLLFGMSACDFLSSFILFLSSWSVPQDTDMFWAAGTTTTCTIHGAVAQASAIATPSYNVMLNLYYVIVVCWGWREPRVKQIQWYFHIWPILHNTN